MAMQIIVENLVVYQLGFNQQSKLAVVWNKDIIMRIRIYTLVKRDRRVKVHTRVGQLGRLLSSFCNAKNVDSMVLC